MGQVAAARFRRGQRLGRRDIEALLRSANRRRSQWIAVSIERNGLAIARVAVLVPKRILGRSVDRNRSKRLIREWFRHRQRDFVGADLLVRLVARPDALDGIPVQLREMSPALGELVRKVAPQGTSR